MPPITIAADTIQPLSPDLYSAQREAMTATLREAGATAVYHAEAPGVPGVRNTELIACFADDADLGKAAASLQAQLRNCADTFLQAPAAMRERHLNLLSSLIPAASPGMQLQDLLGGPSRFPLQTGAQCTLWNVESCASLLVEVTSHHRLTTRAALHTLRRLAENIELATRDRLHCNGAAEFCLRAERLRSGWFQTPRLLRETQLCELWDDAGTVLRSLLAAYAERFASLLRDEPGDMSMRVPGANTTYYFTDTKAPRLLLTQPLATVVQLPRHLGPMFQLLAEPGLGLDRWLSVEQLEESPDVRLDPKFALAAHGYARANAAYFEDMVPQRTPLRLLGGATMAQARTTAAVRVLRMLQRVKAKIAPVGR
jgi:hypothetical protein